MGSEQKFSTNVLSFKFSKTAEVKQLVDRSFEPITATNDIDAKDCIVAVEKQEIITSSTSTSNKKDFIIPLVNRRDWRILQQNTGLNEESNDLDCKAKLALLAEAAEANQKWTLRSESVELVQSIPVGIESKERIELSLHADASEEADYASIPIEEYGKAMLRGMGWREGLPIGKTNAKYVKMSMPKLRPKGLGLGAEQKLLNLNNAAKSKTTNEVETEELTLKKDCCVKVLSGIHKQMYAKIVGFDVDNSRIIVKLALGGSTLSINEAALQPVSSVEYEKDGKCINKEKFDLHKLDQKESQNGNAIETEYKKFVEPKLVFKRKLNDEKKVLKSKRSKDSNYWLYPDIRVRIIDKNYKKGKYFNCKAIVIDVHTRDECTCRTDDGVVLDSLHQSMLETVIPKSNFCYVLILSGKFKGQLAQILDRNKSLCTASVQLVSDRKTIVELDYDCLSEYVADIETIDD